MLNSSKALEVYFSFIAWSRKQRVTSPDTSRLVFCFQSLF